MCYIQSIENIKLRLEQYILLTNFPPTHWLQHIKEIIWLISLKEKNKAWSPYIPVCVC